MGKWNDDSEEEPIFCLHEFKKWMDNQGDTTHYKKNLVGLHIESKISIKKLLEKIQPEEGELYTLAKDFRKNGGIINEVDGQTLLIGVDSGAFLLKKNYVRKID